MGPVQRRVPAVLTMDAPVQRAYSHRFRQRLAPEAGARFHRRVRPSAFPAAADRGDDDHLVAVLPALVWDPRAIDERRRTSPMAGQVPDLYLLLLAVLPGHFGADQANCRYARRNSGSAY